MTDYFRPLDNGTYTREQLDVRRLELENRIRNLFWTVSGDYSLDLKPDIYKFERSKYIAIYDAVKQGACARFFDEKELGLYVLKKLYRNAGETPLMELVKLCLDAAVYPKLLMEREGIAGIRAHAFKEILKNPDDLEPANSIEEARNLYMARFLAARGETAYVRPAGSHVNQLLEEIEGLEGVSTTAELIEVIDRIYNRFFDVSFEELHGGLQEVLSIPSDILVHAADQECWTDELADEILEKYLKNLRMDMLSLEIADRKVWKRDHHSAPKRTPQAAVNEETAKNIQNYVELSYGRSYLRDSEVRHLSALLGRGTHRGCLLHFTEGVLHDPVKKNNQYRYAEMMTQKNRMYYYGNHWIIKRNIANLTDLLRKVLSLRCEQEVWRDRSGELVPSRLWKIGRTEDVKLFNRKSAQDDSEFVVDILLDGSGSQMSRRPQVAAQAFMIAEALSNVGIPARIQSFCTYWDYTVLQRFRDYDDEKDMNLRLFEFQASSSNRDGLAIRAAVHGLAERNEEHKILFILSDGKPNDVSRSSRPEIEIPYYEGESAVRDTAFEVRRARAEGIVVLGVFAGSEDELAAEKKIFGKDFAYIRNISGFSHVVGNYLARQIL